MSATVLKCPACHHPLAAGVEVMGLQKVIYLYCAQPCRANQIDRRALQAGSTEDSFKLLEWMLKDGMQGEEKH